MRAQLERELNELKAEAMKGEMEPDELRRRVTGILDRLLGSTGARADIQRSLDEIIDEYSSLHDAQERLAVLERLFGQF